MIEAPRPPLLPGPAPGAPTQHSLQSRHRTETTFPIALQSGQRKHALDLWGGLVWARSSHVISAPGPRRCGLPPRGLLRSCTPRHRSVCISCLGSHENQSTCSRPP